MNCGDNMNSQKLSRIITILVLFIIVVAIILLFNNRSESVRIELAGQEEMIIYQNSRFIDPGYDLVGSSKNDGFYVNVEGIVNYNVPGIYTLKYSLYNKDARLISSVERHVIVVSKSSNNILMALNGESEEYYFVNDYFDKGAIAYQNDVNISNAIIVDSNVVDNEVGDYEVKYLVNTIGNEYDEISRIVHIIDYSVSKNINEELLKINLIFNCEDYAYTILPNGVREYSKNISYMYNAVGTYKFDVYLNSGSHKEYLVDIISLDNKGPSGTCRLYYYNNKTEITMNVYDESGISKYSYNGLEFVGNKTVENSIITNVTIRAYDKKNNYTDIKCKADYGTELREINLDDSGLVKGKNGYIKCQSSVAVDNLELKTLMESYGYKTRSAVAAAGVYLATYKYEIPYFYGGQSEDVGLNPYWGCRKDHTVGQPCSKPDDASHSICQYGLDCSGFTRWAFIQAGFPLDILTRTDQATGMWGNFKARTHKYDFNNSNISYINQIKPGDIVHEPGHVGLVIGVGPDTIQIAEMRGPFHIDIINKYTGRSLNHNSNFTEFVLMDDFYNMYGNQ